MNTSLERLEQWLAVTHVRDESVAVGSLASADVTVADLRAIAKLARGTQDTDKSELTIRLMREKVDLEKERDELRSRVEVAEADADALHEAHEKILTECASQSGRASAFFEALKLVCKVTP